jgi:chitodextrinase
VEDMTVTSAGSYAATAVLSSAAPTIMQVAAFKALATDVGNLPTAPPGLVATATGAASVSLTWGASNESGGAISQYLIERCQGAGCGAFAQVGVASTPGFTDTALTGSTAYSYRVRAKDTLAVLGPYSNVATATTAAPVITAPTGVSAAAAGASQVSLKWRAATESGGTVSQYRIERCQGAGCTSFVQLATAAGVSFTDAALAAATTYRYRIRAADAAGNLGPYSAVAQATTASSRHWWQFPVRPGTWFPIRL